MRLFIKFGYETTQGGLFCVFLDTRPDAGPDGTWTIRLEGNSIDMPNWPEYSDELGDNFAIKLGEIIRDLAIEFRDQGVLDTLAVKYQK